MRLPNPEIIFEDNHLLVINKPCGLLSQGDDSGHKTVGDLFKEYLKDKYGKPGNVYLGLVHRLDRPVSGAMVLARTSKAASRLSAQFRDGRVEKIYLAVVEGAFDGSRGELRHFMGSGQRDDGRTPISGRTFPGAHDAILSYRILASSGKRQLLRIRPVTGRRHQIRAQLAEAGHPVVGDRKYGAGSGQPVGAIALHAWRLEFQHPTSGEPLKFAAKPPVIDPWPDFATILDHQSGDNT